eukprot:g52537.t1
MEGQEKIEKYAQHHDRGLLLVTCARVKGLEVELWVIQKSLCGWTSSKYIRRYGLSSREHKAQEMCAQLGLECRGGEANQG